MVSRNHSNRNQLALLSAAVLFAGAIWGLDALADHKPNHNPGGGGGRGGGEPPADTGKIVFSRRGENFVDQLVLLDLDAPGGPAETVLLSEPDVPTAPHPRWSHRSDALGRRWILFNAPVHGLSAIKEDGDPQTLHQVIPLGDPGQWRYFQIGPSLLSPDDEWLVFPTRDPLGMAIQPFDWTTGTVFGEPTPLVEITVFGGSWYFTTFAPDGLSIAFPNATSSEAPNDIYRIDLSFASGVPEVIATVNLTQTPDRGESFPEWSAATSAWPHGRLGFLRGSDNGLGFDLAHMDPFNPPDLQVLDIRKIGSRPPTWSPDATRIAFGVNQAPGTNRSELFAVSPDGSGLSRLTDNDFPDGWPAWRPPEFVP